MNCFVVRLFFRTFVVDKTRNYDAYYCFTASFELSVHRHRSPDQREQGGHRYVYSSCRMGGLYLLWHGLCHEPPCWRLLGIPVRRGTVERAGEAIYI